MPYFADENGEISFTAEGVERMDHPIEIPTPPEDARVRGGDTRYQWDTDHKKFSPISTPPAPNQARQMIEQKFVEWEGGRTAGLDRLDELLRQYPTVLPSLQAGNYENVQDRINRAVDNTDLALTQDEADQITAILEGSA